MKLIAHDALARGVLARGAPRWRENNINESLFYSYRKTDYSKETFPSTLHYHDYYELVIYVKGDIHYICESATYRPRYGDILIVPPGRVHMSMLDAEHSQYERHVFYVYPDALDAIGGAALTAFLSEVSKEEMTVLVSREKRKLLSLLEELDRALSSAAPPERALALSHVLRVFYMINTAVIQSEETETLLPPNVLAVRQYIDEHFSEILSVSDIAKHFYYSREYISRLFKQYFNTTVADYLRTRRVAYSCTLIAQGVPLDRVCFQSGFGNLSTFIRSFRTVTGMNPSAYRALQ